MPYGLERADVPWLDASILGGGASRAPTPTGREDPRR